MFSTFVYVMLSLQNAKTSIKRFQRMLFGHRTEHKRNVLERAAQADQSGESDALDADPAPALPGVLPCPGHPARPWPNAAHDYSGAPIVQCDHPDFESGDRCPQCDKGRVYESPPRSIVKVVGQRRWGPRCTSCSGCAAGCATASSPPPCPRRWPAAEVDSSCASMIALLRYGNGMPHFRLEGLQASLYVPLPDATQWDIVFKAVPAPRAVFQALIVQAAQAPLLHSDDTPMKVLSLMAERTARRGRRRQAGGQGDQYLGDRRRRARGRQAAPGGAVLHRPRPRRQQHGAIARTPRPGAGAGDPDERRAGVELRRRFKTVLANCLPDGRRKVADVVEHFPEASRHVIEVLAEVYKHNETCRRTGLSAEQRLPYHQ